MTAAQTPPASDSDAEALTVSVAGGHVVLQAPGSGEFMLSPEAAVRAAERLLEAADQARSASGGAGAERAKPPFPPANLVSPHGAG